MKQIETTKGHILAVKVPECANRFSLIKNGSYVKIFYHKSKWTTRVEFISIPTGNWQIINTWSKLTEQQAAMMVEAIGVKGYKNYWNDNGFVPRGFNHTHKTALESFASLMHANGCYLVNPMGKFVKETGHSDDCHCKSCDKLFSDWQKYQEATGGYLILFKPNK